MSIFLIAFLVLGAIIGFQLLVTRKSRQLRKLQKEELEERKRERRNRDAA
jgi:regulatory protein YycI of two-component signal transduction system YycFG